MSVWGMEISVDQKIPVNPNNLCMNMKIYLFFIILDIISATVVLDVVVSVESSFIFNWPSPTHAPFHFIVV